MSASHHTEFCDLCDKHADECECCLCDDCGEREATIFGAADQFCTTCRSKCCCGEPIGKGQRLCWACRQDEAIDAYAERAKGQRYAPGENW